MDDDREQIIKVINGFHHELGQFRIIASRYQEDPLAGLTLDTLHQFKSMSESDLARYMDTNIERLRPILGVLEWLSLIAHRNSSNNSVIWYIDYTEIFDTMVKGVELNSLMKRAI